jgi:hypothetical protein
VSLNGVKPEGEGRVFEGGVSLNRTQIEDLIGGSIPNTPTTIAPEAGPADVFSPLTP